VCLMCACLMSSSEIIDRVPPGWGMHHEFFKFYMFLIISSNNAKSPNQWKLTIHGRPESGPDPWPPAVVLAGGGQAATRSLVQI